MKENPFADRLAAFAQRLRTRRLACAFVCGEANIRALTGVVCDNACLLVTPGEKGASAVFYTDFRYAPMVRRMAPFLVCRDLRRLGAIKAPRRAGCEFTLSHARYLKLRKLFPRTAFADVAADLTRLRSVKTTSEIAALRAAERLDCEIWRTARDRFAAGMTEREMARIIRTLMIARGDGEAFETIVCIGRNAAECHHVPNDTVWDGREPVLVDMGVKLGGYCSDLTRNILPKRASRLYRRVYGIVRDAHDAVIAAARPGLTAGALDRVAREVIRKGGFGRCFGHSLGHGVGLEIHEAPTARKGDRTVLEPGMLVTVEPGVYLEGNLGVRIEDLILITESGCEVLSDWEAGTSRSEIW